MIISSLLPVLLLVLPAFAQIGTSIVIPSVTDMTFGTTISLTAVDTLSPFSVPTDNQETTPATSLITDIPTTPPTSSPPATPTSTPTTTPSTTPSSTPTSTPTTTPTTTSTTTSSTPTTSASSSPSSQITPTSTTPSTASANTPAVSSSTPSPKSASKVGPVVGGVVGGVGGTIAIVIATVFTAQHLPWLWASLACLLGFFAFRTRRIVVIMDEELPECQVGFFLTTTPELDKLKKSNIIWKVNTFGGEQREFTIDIPCWPNYGVTRLGYGTVKDEDDRPDYPYITVVQSEDAPATLDDEGTFTSPDPKELKITKINQLSLSLQSDATQDQNIVLGTIDESKEIHTQGRIHPFLLIEDFKSRFALGSDIYLHAFRVRNEMRAGDYGYNVGNRVNNSLESEVIEGDRITLKHGIRVNTLEPLTTWYIIKKEDGGLRIVSGKNKKSDFLHFNKTQSSKSKNEWEPGNNVKQP